jgi:hypothetical protein
VFLRFTHERAPWQVELAEWDAALSLYPRRVRHDFGVSPAVLRSE